MAVSEKDRRHFAVIAEGMLQKEAERRTRAATRDPGENATRMLERSEFWLGEVLRSRAPSEWPFIDGEDELVAQADLQRLWTARPNRRAR